jgi:hypothetical protein
MYGKGMAWRGAAGPGLAGHGVAMQGRARLGKGNMQLFFFSNRGAERLGAAWQGKGNMIYILQMSGTDYYKVGYTSKQDASNRLASLQTGCPKKLIIMAAGDGSEKDEQLTHLSIWQYRTDGGDEWFQLPLDIAEQLINRFGGLQNEYQEIQRSFSGITPADVRPICRRQQHQVTDNREDVPFKRSAADYAGAERHVPVVRREHKVSMPSILREER